MDATNALIMVGLNDVGSTYDFRPLRGFLLNDEGIAQARQYVNMLIEARPYENAPVVMVLPLGLMSTVPDELTRDKAVDIGTLFPLAPFDEAATQRALNALRSKLGVPPTCINAVRGLGADCAGPVRHDEESGLMLCEAHTHPDAIFNGGLIPGRED